MRRLRILTWHVHGNYLLNLSHIPHDIYLPTRRDSAGGYGGRGATFPFPDNVIEIPAEDVCRLDFDCVLFQSPANYTTDRFELLSASQRRLPSIYLEHDPPRISPTDTPHVVIDRNVLVVHVTHFNALMWDNGDVPVRVIEHGVALPREVSYSGEREAGIVVVNNLASRGRRLGADLFLQMRKTVPLDLAGMNSEQLGGLGEIHPMNMAAVEARYRFFFNPIRWTSLGLAVIEAMSVGMPVVAFATTEMATVIQDGVTGFAQTDPKRLETAAHRLLADPEEARRIGAAGREVAMDRFSIERFVRDWNAVLAEVCSVSARNGARAGAAGVPA